MQSIDCEEHQLKKDFVFCLEQNCKDRLVCKKCYLIDKKHFDHKCIYIKYFMKSDYHELKKLFNQTYAETVRNNQSIKSFNQLLDAKVEKLLDERDEMLRLPFEKMLSDYRLSFQNLKKELCQKYNVNQLKSVDSIQQNVKDLLEKDNSQQKQQELKELIDRSNQIVDIQKQLESVLQQTQQDDKQMLDDIQQTINKYKLKQNSVFRYHITDLEVMNQLYQSTEICILDASKIDEYRNEIRQYQQGDKPFKILVGFYQIPDPNHRKQVFDMIDQLNVNHKVGRMNIIINDSNKTDTESVMKMVNKYINLYGFYINDYLNQVDNSIHDSLKDLLKQKIILELYVRFYGSLKNSDDGLNLLKQYNQIIKYNNNLKYLSYQHSKINKSTGCKEQIEQLINDVANM